MQIFQGHSGEWAATVLEYQSQTGGRLAKRPDMRPFMVGFFGFKALRLSSVSLDQDLCGAVGIVQAGSKRKRAHI